MPRKPSSPSKRTPSRNGSVTLRWKELSGGRQSAYLDVYHDGKRSYQFLGLYLTGRKEDREQDREQKRLAEIAASERLSEVKAGRSGVVPEHIRKADFLVYVEAFCSEKGHNSWACLAKHFKTFLGARQVPMSAVSPSLVEGFRTWLLEHYQRNTAALYFGKFRTLCDRAHRKGLLASNPCKQVGAIRMIDTERVYLSAEELGKLAGARCRNEEVKRAFLFAAATGLRLSDIEALRWESIRDGRIEYRQKKTSKVEYLPLNDTALKYLGPIESQGQVFKLPVRSGIGESLTRWALTAGLSKAISFHTARHTFATLSLGAGADLYTVSKLLGHSDVRTTTIYAKVVDERKREAVNLLPSF